MFKNAISAGKVFFLAALLITGVVDAKKAPTKTKTTTVHEPAECTATVTSTYTTNHAAHTTVFTTSCHEAEENGALGWTGYGNMANLACGGVLAFGGAQIF